MNPFDDTVVMRDDTDVMPACSLPVPPGEPARRRPPLSGRRRVDVLLLVAVVAAASSVPPLVEGAPAVPVLRVLTSNVVTVP